MQATYRRAPRDLRGGVHSTTGLTLKLPYAPPYHWKALIAFLKPRAIPGVEIVEDGMYRRTVRLGRLAGTIEVRPVSGENCLSAKIAIGGVHGLRDAVERLRRLFDLHANTPEIAAALCADPILRPAVEAYPGLRIPGAWDIFELGVRAILGQQISVRAATTLAGRIAGQWGEALPGCDLRLFPTPETLASVDLTTIGVTRKRAEALSRFARTYDALDFSSRGTLPEVVNLLTAIEGIGDWTAHYIAMRGFGEPDAFPALDLGLRRAAGNLSAADLLKRAEAWRPWRAYAAMYLWTNGGSNGTAL